MQRVGAASLAILGVALVVSGGGLRAEITPRGAVACLANTDCAATELCQRPVGACGAAGECVARPGACAAVVDPVCGCDGKTYSNRCAAASNGASVAATGRCPDDPSPRDPRCSTNADCEPGQFCARPRGTCAGDGECAPRPQVCIQVFDPVCGCDGRTYGNACTAGAAGVVVASAGECPPPEQPCTSAADCGPAAFCERPVGSCAAGGTCRALPDVCGETAPVCGCDARTYDNACQAAGAGVAVAAAGACQDGVCTGRPECGSAEVVVPELPVAVVPRVEVTCRAGDAGAPDASGECEAAGFVADGPATPAARGMAAAEASEDLGRRVTRRRVKPLRDGRAILRLKLNPLGRRLLRRVGRQGQPLGLTVVVTVRTASGEATLRQLVQLRKLRTGG